MPAGAGLEQACSILLLLALCISTSLSIQWPLLALCNPAAAPAPAPAPASAPAPAPAPASAPAPAPAPALNPINLPLSLPSPLPLLLLFGRAALRAVAPLAGPPGSQLFIYGDTVYEVRGREREEGGRWMLRMNEGIHLDLDTWIVPGQIRKANL